jgi:Helix-turn-helix domain
MTDIIYNYLFLNDLCQVGPSTHKQWMKNKWRGDHMTADLDQWRRLVASVDGPQASVTRLLLHTLAVYLDPGSGSCFRSVRDLSEATALSRRAVIKHLKLAESHGWIKIESAGIGGKGWKRSSYSLRFPFEAVNRNHHVETKNGESESPRQADLNATLANQNVNEVNRGCQLWLK